MTPPICEANQLAEILEEIRQIEDSPGFKGPKIAKEISHSKIAMSPLGGGPGAYMYLHCWEDHVVGAIERACDECGWISEVSGPHTIVNRTMYRSKISCNNHFLSEGSSRVVALAMAYRDALKAEKS